jgi:hypothetical protein
MKELALYGHGRWGTAIAKTFQNFPNVSVEVGYRKYKAPFPKPHPSPTPAPFLYVATDGGPP